MSLPSLPTGNHISQGVYRTIADSIDFVARNGEGVSAPYTVGEMDWDYEEGVVEPEDTPIGISRAIGAIGVAGWSRFTTFLPEAESILRHGHHAAFMGIRGQLELEKEATQAGLQATLRTVELDGIGKVFMDFNGHMSAQHNPEDATGYEFYRFARQFGLDPIWKRIENDRLEVSMKGWLNTSLGRPIAAALGGLAASSS